MGRKDRWRDSRISRGNSRRPDGRNGSRLGSWFLSGAGCWRVGRGSGGDLVGQTDGGTVGRLVGMIVGTAVGKDVGSSVGLTVVGQTDGLQLGLLVGLGLLGFAVGG